MKFPKTKKIILTGEAYKALQLEVFTADKWKCRICNKIKPLQLHHMKPRSLGRDDSLTNCLSLCGTCHQYVTEKIYLVEWIDAEARTITVEKRELFAKKKRALST